MRVVHLGISSSFVVSAFLATGCRSESPAPVSVHVSAVGAQPVAVDDFLTVPEEGGNGVSVIDNDTGLGDGIALVEIETPPLYGQAFMSTPFETYYLPDTDFAGSDSFEYRVTDVDGDFDVGTVFVTVTPVNDRPLCGFMNLFTNEDTPLTFSLPCTGLDLPVAVTVNFGAGLGSIVFGTDGQATYTPNPDAFGQDYVQFALMDPESESAVGDLSIDIFSVDDVPFAQDDFFAVPEDAGFTALDVLANDNGLGDGLGQLEVLTQPASGTLQAGPFLADLEYRPAPGFNGQVTFTYRVSDQDFQSSEATVTVDVTAVDDVPNPQPDGVHVLQGASNKVYVLDNDHDIDEGPLTVSIATAPATGTATVTSSGAIVYAGSTVTGITTFTYLVTDADGDSGTGTVTAFIHNSLQVDVGPRSQTVDEGTAATWAGEVATSSVPSRAVWDFDGDATDDLVLCDADGGTAAPSCATRTERRVFDGEDTLRGSDARHDIVAADLDQDGHLDLVTGGNVAIFYGDGSGGFHSALQLGTYAWRIAVADIDGDGDPDLALLRPATSDANDSIDNNEDGEVDEPGEGGTSDVAVWLNDGSGFNGGAGSFPVEALTYVAGPGGIYGEASGLAAGDIDEDGDDDLLVTVGGFFGSRLFFLREVAGSLVVDEPFLVDIQIPVGAALADISGDGHLDVLISDVADGIVRFLLGDGAGQFVHVSDHFTNPFAVPAHISAGDVDADGDLDVTVGGLIDSPPSGNFGGFGLTYVFFTDAGQPGFTPEVFYAGGRPFIADFDSDGVAEVGATQPGAGALFRSGVSARSPGAIASLAADLDGDGNVDLATAGFGVVRILRGDGAGNVGVRRVAHPGLGLFPVDLRGKKEFVSLRENLLTPMLVGADGNGALAAPLLLPIGGPQFGAFASGRFDGDVFADLFTLTFDGLGNPVLRVYAGTGTAAVGAELHSEELIQVFSGLAVGDLNGDGFADAIVHEGNVAVLYMADGTGGMTYGGEVAFPDEIGVGADWIVDDVSGDGIADLVASRLAFAFDVDFSLLTYLEVYLGGPTQPFARTTHVLGSSQGSPALLAIGDVSGDGTVDIAVSEIGRVSTLLGTGGGAFDPPLATAHPFDFDTVHLADFDADGRDDLLLSRDLRALVTALSAGDGTFSPLSEYGLSIYDHQGVHPIDLDGDGRSDVIASLDEGISFVRASTVRHVLDVGASALYPDSGTFDAFVRTTVGATTLNAGPLSVVVTEVGPVVGPIEASFLSIVEREPGVVYAYAAQNDADPISSCEWDFGDGTPLLVDPTCGGYPGSAVAFHAFPDGDPSQYFVTLTVYDEDGFATTDGFITVENGAPQVALVFPPVITEGVAASISAVITDSDDSYWEVTWTPDFEPADFDVVDVPLATRGFTVAAQGPQNLTVEVQDQSDPAGVPSLYSLIGTTSGSFNVVDHVPLIGAIGSTANPSVEGAQVTFTASVSAVAADPIASCVWSFGDGSAPVADPACVPGSTVASPSMAHVFADGDPTTYTVTLSVTDEDGTVQRTLGQTVQNLAPSITVDSISPDPSNEGSAVTVDFTVTDPAGSLDGFYRLEWSWGDGVTETTIVSSVGAGSRSHVYADDATYPISVEVTDQSDAVGNVSPGSLSDTDIGTANVVNVDPALAAIASPQSATEGQVFLVQASSSDPGADPPVYSLTAAPSGMSVLAASGIVAWSPSYLQSGPAPGAPHSVTVNVADGDGGTDTTSFTVNVVWKDDDADGMADTWELANGLDPTENDASEDADGDGVSNLDEFLADTPSGARAPGAVGLVSPADGAMVTANDPVFSVANAVDLDGGPLTYRVQLASDAGFTSVLVVASGAETAVTSMVTIDDPVDADLLDDATYFWRARAVDPGGLAGPWSAPRSFFYSPQNDAPSAPGVVSPADASQVSSLSPALVVAGANDVDDAEASLTFRFQVWDDAALTDPPTADSGTITAAAGGVQVWPVDVALSDDTTYWWTVTVVDPGSASTETGASTFRVNLGNSEPGVPIAVAPLAGAAVPSAPSLTVTNAVDADGDALEYLFELDVTAAFNGPDYQSSGWIAAGATQTAWTPQGALVENRVYQWRARATDGLSIGDVASGSFRLDAANDAPTAAVLLSPIDGETLLDGITSVTFANGADPEDGALTWTVQVWEGNVAGAAADVIASATGAVPAGAAFTAAALDVPVEGKGTYAIQVTHADALAASSTPALAIVHVKSAGEGTKEAAGCGCALGTRARPAPGVILALAGVLLALRRRRGRDR